MIDEREHAEIYPILTEHEIEVGDGNYNEVWVAGSEAEQALAFERSRAVVLFDAVDALWKALNFFTAEEFGAKPDEFHRLVALADERCRMFRPKQREDA